MILANNQSMLRSNIFINSCVFYRKGYFSMVSTSANFLSIFLSGMTSASKVSVSAMRRLIDHSNPRITPHFDPEPPLFLPAALSLSDIRLFDASFAPAAGYCLLFVAEGRGFLEITKNTAQNITQDGTDHNNIDHHSLKKYSLFFFPLSKRWRLCLENAPWKFYIFFLSGVSVSYYNKLFSDSAKEPFLISASSMLPLHLSHLYDALSDCNHDPLWLSEQLTSLLCLTIKEARCHAQSSLPYMIPSYLISIRNSFHKNFAKPFSLAELETQYEISRFRIAHEFTAAFGQSPIAYLNGLRLQKACELLTRGDDRIGEISTAVGFENANHFINLFRRQYGMTPGTYRKHYQQHITSERRSASELPRG